MFRPPTPLVKNLLIINIGIALIASFMKIDLGEVFALYPILSDRFAPYQFITYMFLHGSVGHILNNMLILFFVGPMLEGFLGPKKFLALYMVTGVGGGLLYAGADYVEQRSLINAVEAYRANPSADSFNRLFLEHGNEYYGAVADFIEYYAENENDPAAVQRSFMETERLYNTKVNVPMVGASGAMFGILAMLMLLFPNTEILLFFTFPIKIKYLVGGLIVFEVFQEMERVPGDNVAHLAHLGGALFAWFLLRYWKKDRSSFY